MLPWVSSFHQSSRGTHCSHLLDLASLWIPTTPSSVIQIKNNLPSDLLVFGILQLHFTIVGLNPLLFLNSSLLKESPSQRLALSSAGHLLFYLSGRGAPGTDTLHDILG